METPSITASAGFHYTPPSYLLRTSDTINRPWQGKDYTEDYDGDHGSDGENEYDLPQEERPQTRRESYVDAHFHQRVRTKQNRYRDLIHQQQEQEHQAETNYYELHPPPNNTSHEDDNDSLLRLSRTVDRHQDSCHQSSPSRGYRKASIASLASSGSTATTAASTTRSNSGNYSSSRMASSSRISSSTWSSVSASSDAEARSLRSQRLRKNLLKVSDEEYDLQAKLERRRQLAREEDGRNRSSIHADEYNCSASQMSSLTELPFSATSDSERERQALLQERRKLKEEREALAKTKRQAAVALREMNDAKAKTAKAKAEKAEFLKKHPKKTARQVRLDKAKKFHRVRRSYLSSTYTDCCTDDSSEFYEPPDSDFAFLKDLQGIVRETEFLQSCLTLNCCHGEEVAGFLESEEAPPLPAMVACSDQSDESGDPLPDVLLNDPHQDDDASLDHSLRRSRIYAKFKA